MNPVKCGMLKYGLYLHTHECAATDFESNWYGFTAMVHLYATCRSVFPNDPVWPDMVSLTSNYSEVSSAPPRIQESVRATLLIQMLNSFSDLL